MYNKFEKYCDNREIFYIEDRSGYYWINGADGYKKSDWTLEEAVNDYKSVEEKARRFESEYRSWCD
jgi:hypothetical protein